MTPDELIGLSIRLPQSLLAKIDALAEQERRSRGNLIRVLLERVMSGQPEPTPVASVRKADKK
jgi:metal-responsive CopG/Arc/MetJ family transcriptional regulator